jgi:hypothetical protein
MRPMNRSVFKTLALAFVVGGSSLVAMACEDNDGPVENAAEDIGEAADEAADDIEDAVD